MSLFHGVGAAMVTPFDGDGNINYTALEAYIEHLIGNGVAALFPFGTTGEPATVAPDEYERATKFVISKAGGRVPVIVGAGSNNTKTAAEKTAKVKAWGADGALVVTPYYNKCTQAGIIEHYKAVAKAGLPVIAYNVPTRTCVNIAPSTVARLAEIDGIAGIKEASGDIDQFRDVARVCAETGLDLYCGDDSLTLIAYALGSLGTISVAANPAPALMSKLCSLCEGGNFTEARKLQFALAEFIHALFIEVSPIAAKKAMQLIGIDVGAPRLPLTPLEPQHETILRQTMQDLGLLK